MIKVTEMSAENADDRNVLSDIKDVIQMIDPVLTVAARGCHCI